MSLRELVLSTGQLLYDAIPDEEFWRFQKVIKHPEAPFLVEQRFHHLKLIHLRLGRAPISDEFWEVKEAVDRGRLRCSEISSWDHTLLFGLNFAEWQSYVQDEHLMWPIFEIIDKDLIFPTCRCEGCKEFHRRIHLRTYPIVMRMLKQPALPLAA